MPLRRGFSAGRLAEAAEESVKKARESFKDELRGLLTELRELSCRHFFSPPFSRYLSCMSFSHM